MAPDIFSKRGITPPWDGGEVARLQGFVRYEGTDWKERRRIVAEHEPLYGSDNHPDPGKALELWWRAVERELNPLDRWGRPRDPRGPHRVQEVGLYLEEKGGLPHWLSPSLQKRYHDRRNRANTAWKTWLRKALSCDGWLMPRHAVFPSDYELSDFAQRPVAQLRPDQPLVMGEQYESHDHGFRLQSRERPAHEAKVCDKAPAPGDPGYPHPAAIHHPAGAFLPTGHLHPVTGEVVVPFEAEGRYIWHSHWKHAKYLYTPGETALRLGTNPVALERGWGSSDDLFVVVMEGTLKMCSVVEAGYPAIDAGSVTLWHGETLATELDEGVLTGGPVLELEAFAEGHLEGRPVAVVCDSDWKRNAAVYEHTSEVVAVLNAKGADPVIGAPPEGAPLGWVHPLTGVEMREKIGVDDWLGQHPPEARHEALLELVCPTSEGSPTLTPDDPRLQGGTYRSRRENAVRVLLAMGETTLPGSDIAPFSKTELAERLDLPGSTVRDAFELAVQRGLATRITEARRQWRPERRTATMTAPLVRLTPEALPQYSEPTLRVWLERRHAATRPTAFVATR